MAVMLSEDGAFGAERNGAMRHAARQSMAAGRRKSGSAGNERLGDVPRERPAAAAMEEGGMLLEAINTRMAM